MRITLLNLARGVLVTWGLALTGCQDAPAPSLPAAAHYPTSIADKPQPVAGESPNDKLVANETPAPIKPPVEDQARPPEKPPAEEHPAIQARSKPRGNDREPIEVGFDDLNLSMQMDVVFRPWMMTDRVKELEGKRIKLKGYMLANDRTKHIKEFVLLKNTECKFGPGGQADHLAEIVLQGTTTTDYTTKPVEVEGVLKLTPFTGPDGNTWSIYKIEATAVRGL